MNIEEMVFVRFDEVGFDSLTEVEKCYWLIWQLEAEANNGGLEAFLENSIQYSKETIDALEKVKAYKMASLLSHAVDLYTEDTEKLESNEMRSLSDCFTDYPDKLGDLLDSYVNQNTSQLLGPKTDIELWQAKKKLGQNVPSFVTKEIDYEVEAKEDAKYSSRACPECSQPVPDYRKTCKKCGFPVGRKIQP
ncbi:DUF4375 domain-containing protein [Motilimonas sp. KMU-193]|uniref:DMP19 family protein n=1 Tax=Motilimonas sp. KMU-193 TaxID=3388668 RepID=UPI00396B3708